MSEEQAGWGGDLWAAADLITPMAIRVAATLRLADHIATGTDTADLLAAATRTHPDALGRVLNHLVTAGVLSTEDAGAYSLTPLGERLRDDHPDGVRAWLDIDGSVGRAELSFVQLLHTVRTGEPAFPQQFGRPYWDDLAADPARSASFDALMAARLTNASDVAAAYPWGSLGHVIDVGGGNGRLLAEVLTAHPDLRGTVVDLAGPAERAREAFAAAGLGDRADARAGSFFDALPAGAGGYVLSGVLHDWDDDAAVRILKRCAEAVPDSGKVLVVADGDGGAPDTEGDLRMLCYVGGRDRSLEQLRELAGKAGLRVGSVIPVGYRLLVELLPSR